MGLPALVPGNFSRQFFLVKHGRMPTSLDHPWEKRDVFFSAEKSLSHGLKRCLGHDPMPDAQHGNLWNSAQGLEHSVVERMGWQLHLSSFEGSQGGHVMT